MFNENNKYYFVFVFLASQIGLEYIEFYIKTLD